MNKQNTIVSVSINRSSRNKIHLTIKDEHSRDRVLDVCMDLESFAYAITGLSEQKAIGWVNTEANIAKQRETMDVSMPCSNYMATPEEVIEHFENSAYYKNGWVLHSNNCNSKQNTKGVHVYSIKRYVDVEDPLKLEDGW